MPGANHINRVPRTKTSISGVFSPFFIPSPVISVFSFMQSGKHPADGMFSQLTPPVFDWCSYITCTTQLKSSQKADENQLLSVSIYAEN